MPQTTTALLPALPDVAGKRVRAKRFGARSPATQRGMALMFFGVSLFSIHNVLAKWLAADYDVVEILFFRHLFGLVPVLAYLLWSGGPALLRWRGATPHLTRGIMGVSAGAGMFYAFAQMPLADATAIAFAVPLFITALSVPMLGEQVGWRRWSAVLVGFLGVLVILRPGAGMLGLAAGVALLASLGIAVTMILTRRMSRSEHSATIAFYFTLIALVASGAALPFGWQAPGLYDLALFAALGLLGGVGIVLVTLAYRLAPAAVVAPFDYTQILWALVLGFALWGDTPGLNVGLGAAIVIASGLYIVHREVRRRGAARAEAAASG